MAIKYTSAGLDTARRAKRLLKKKAYHESLVKARVRIDIIFAESVDGEEAPVKANGYPALAAASSVPAKYRGAVKGDGRIVIDKEAWGELTEKQRDALLDHELYHFEAVINEGEIATDGNDRPRLRLRKHDVQLGFFSTIAREHGEHSQEVIQARALVEHARDVFLPGFDVLAKPLPGKRGKKVKGEAIKALQQAAAGNVIDLPAGTNHAVLHQVAAK